jgi:hypothetical protein
VGLEWNGTHQLLCYSGDMILLGVNIDTINKNTEIIIHASKRVPLEVNVEKTKYMFVPHHQNSGQNREIQLANITFEYMSQFKYL